MVKLTIIAIVTYLLTHLTSRKASGLYLLQSRSKYKITQNNAVLHGSQDGTMLGTSVLSQADTVCKDEFEVSFPYPTGLLVSNVDGVNYCLLQHNVVKLRQSYRRVSQVEGAISETICAQIIHEAEVCASLNGGWTANRHSAYPTTDLPLEAIFGKFSSIHGLVNGYLLPEIASFFGLNEDFLSIGEIFVAKYEYGVKKQAGLGAHVDGTPWSFVVSLNNPATDFVGGGTRFVEEGVTYRPAGVGTAVIFSGKNMHEGVPITSGVRYILTGFCNYKDKNTDHEVFMSSYDPYYDGSAASGKQQQQRHFSSNRRSDEGEDTRIVSDCGQVDEELNGSGSALEVNRSGIRIGDILKAIWIPDIDPRSSGPILRKGNSFLVLEDESDSRGKSRGEDRGTETVGAEIDKSKSSGVLTADNQAICPGAEDLIKRDEERNGRYVYVERLSEEEVKALVARSGVASESVPCTCSVIVQRDDVAMEESSLNEEQRNIPRIASSLLSIGKYWSFDEVLDGSA